MKLKTITFSHSYEFQEYGLKRWNGLKLEGELAENEDPLSAHEELKKIGDAIKSATIATLEETKGTYVRDIVEEPVDKIKVMITVINLCASMEALLRFAKQVDRENNQELTEAYNNKLQSLKNGQDSFKDISNRF